MAGKLCDGTVGGARHLKDSKTYCEGRGAAADGAALEDNPHTEGTAENAAWALGHASWELDPTGHPGDCCADAYGGGYVPE